MLKELKQLTLKGLKASRGFSIARKSRWRKERLLILGYHGVSLDDEHQWDPALYLNPDYFRERLQLLKEWGCVVLPLAEALRRLAANDLPPMGVSLTFDDGTYDFYERAYPILKDFNFPVTLYLTTFYSLYNRPVFDSIIYYLLWKGRSATLHCKEFTGRDEVINLSSASDRAKVGGEIEKFALRNRLTAEEKDELAEKLAGVLRVDYDALLSKRILHIMKPAEVNQLAADGVDIQLHTHRHRTPRDYNLFRREIEDNRNTIRTVAGRCAQHFCYPSGDYHADFFPWLKELDVASATTCDPGLASRTSHQLLLPRLMDSSFLSPIEFEGWLTGVSTVLPRRGRNHLLPQMPVAARRLNDALRGA